MRARARRGRLQGDCQIPEGDLTQIPQDLIQCRTTNSKRLKQKNP